MSETMEFWVCLRLDSSLSPWVSTNFCFGRVIEFEDVLKTFFATSLFKVTGGYLSLGLSGDDAFLLDFTFLALLRYMSVVGSNEKVLLVLENFDLRSSGKFDEYVFFVAVLIG